MNYHFPAFCCPLLILSVRLWGLLPFGFRRTGIQWRLSHGLVAFWAAVTGRPLGIAPFPRVPVFLLPAAVAWIGIRGPRLSRPPERVVANPPDLDPKQCNAEVSNAVVFVWVILL